MSQLTQSMEHPQGKVTTTTSKNLNKVTNSNGISNCSMSQFESCLLLIKSVTESDDLAFASNQKQLQSACNRMQDGVKCADDHMRRCVSPSQRQLFEEVVSGTREVLIKLCIPGPVQRGKFKRSNNNNNYKIIRIKGTLKMTINQIKFKENFHLPASTNCHCHLGHTHKQLMNIFFILFY